jgi:transcription initiation factor TFIID TATA-box-binding protein
MSLYTSRREISFMADLKIENIIGHIQVARILDLEIIFDLFPNAKYDPEEVPALVIKFEEPKSVSMLFKHGRIIFSGIKRFEDIEKIKDTICTKLNQSGIKTYKDPTIEIKTIITSTDINKNLDLESIAKSLDGFEYNPKIFPGLVYKNTNQNTVILLFHSGKIVGSGLELEEISTTIDKIITEISSLKIN